MYTTGQKFGILKIFYYFWNDQHLFDQKYRKYSNIAKYY